MQSALFNFQSLLLVLLLVICTSTYAHATFPKIMDRNREGCVLVCVASRREEADVFITLGYSASSGNARELESG